MPHNLGVEISNGRMSVIIPRGTKIPAMSTDYYSTVTDNQTEVKISVFMGDDEQTQKNKLIGTFMLTGIRKAKCGVPKIEVNFEVDKEGILTVSATENSSGESTQLNLRVDKE